MRPDEIDSHTPNNLLASPLSSRATSLLASRNSPVYDAIFDYLKTEIDEAGARTIMRSSFLTDDRVTNRTLSWGDVRVKSRIRAFKRKLLIVYIREEARAERIVQNVLSLEATMRSKTNIEPVTIEIRAERDIKIARKYAERMTFRMSFSSGLAITKLVTVISELARNICNYAVEKGYSGSITMTPLEDGKVLEVVAEDTGPGIPEDKLELILSGGYKRKSQTGYGVGIHGTREIMDTFNIDSKVGRGTKIVATMKRR